MSGGVVALSLVGLVVVTFWLSLYVYGLYAVGRWLAIRFRTRIGPWAAIGCFAAIAILFDLPVLLFKFDPIFKTTCIFGVWLVHAQPPSVGYWAACELQRKGDEERWERTANEWLAEFEDRAPDWLNEYEDDC